MKIKVKKRIGSPVNLIQIFGEGPQPFTNTGKKIPFDQKNY
jgi:hypothetical protein